MDGLSKSMADGEALLLLQRKLSSSEQPPETAIPIPNKNLMTDSDDSDVEKGQVAMAPTRVGECSVLTAPVLLRLSKPPGYVNLAPWATKLFFAHTYYAYFVTFVSYMLLFYKGYTLEYPAWRRPMEMCLVMCIPILQHVRFYFGHWCFDLGLAPDQSVFMVACAAVLWLHMYFLFKQAYMFPMEATLHRVEILLTTAEGLIGIFNVLQTVAMCKLSIQYKVSVWLSTLLFLTSATLFVVGSLHPGEGWIHERNYTALQHF
eukprot:gnl/TRDRNA2_/TRDRNA2_181462_c0_seq1.p1 gnl/TRDRNA2_/TRDRNA2_181462_c0~~gnl/TRDRNA2_/TRDRNA2_181462_c0_seq1.p1  ORF type:complete len:261 (-),score=49.04 gnl/TRDRNA2_/TRDRNA2_181462_c0_seq1:27-809(-)